jgi:hypothetical protein
VDQSAHTSRRRVFDEVAPRSVFYSGHGITNLHHCDRILERADTRNRDAHGIASSERE